jgi:D-sedoheptulose 7-phosphate isomerase
MSPALGTLREHAVVRESLIAYLERLGHVLRALPVEPIARIAHLLLEAGRAGRSVWVLGNGGSAATASHFACDLAKTATVVGAPRLRALALTDNVPLLTAWGNDVSYEVVFAEQVRSFVRADDLVVAISASGNSPNVLAAAAVTLDQGARLIGITGFGGGRLQPLCDVCLTVPSAEYGPVEDAHMILVHAVTAALRTAMQREHGEDRDHADEGPITTLTCPVVAPAQPGIH